MSLPSKQVRRPDPAAASRMFFAPWPLRMGAAILGLLLLPACSTDPTHDGTPRLVTDDIGRRVRVPEAPRRIVSLAPSVTETLFALGVGERVVGVTDFCDDPPSARSRPRVGGLVNPSWETIVSLRPDLVLASTAGNDRAVVVQAASLQLPLFFVDIPDLEGLFRAVARVGDLVDASTAAERLVKRLRARLHALEVDGTEGPRPKVLFLVWTDPVVVPGGGTFLDDALGRAGCESISSDAPTGWPTYDLETILLRKPDWILAARSNAPFLDALSRKPGWKDLGAVRRGRVATVSDAIERPSPRVLDAMEEVRRLLRRGAK